MDKTLKIILADDHPRIREGLASLLLDCGLENIQLATDGLEVLQLVRKDPPDVILMDIQMPNMDGIEATRIVKEIAPNTKIIGLSIADPILIELIYEAGADGFVSKTFANETLYYEIERLCT